MGAGLRRQFCDGWFGRNGRVPMSDGVFGSVDMGTGDMGGCTMAGDTMGGGHMGGGHMGGGNMSDAQHFASGRSFAGGVFGTATTGIELVMLHKWVVVIW